jgi:hypothetical protein
MKHKFLAACAASIILGTAAGFVLPADAAGVKAGALSGENVGATAGVGAEIGPVIGPVIGLRRLCADQFL